MYFLHWQIDLHATRFASRRDKDDVRPDGRQWLQRAEQLTGFALDAQLQRWFERYQFRSVIPNASVALNHWLGGKWPLHLLRHIPTPREVLSMQVRGVRPVTLIVDRERMHQPALTKANGFVFMVHDLEHAYKFFHDPKLNVMQRNLFAALAHACAAGLFFDDLSDAEFAARFDYLISDMNTHPVHGLQYLRAILVERYLHREGGHLTPDARARVAQVLRTIGAYVDARGDVNVAFENIGLGLSRDADALAIERHLASAVFRCD